MSKCKCYHTKNTLRYTYDPITGSPIPHDIEVGVCWGTKECDECRCGGDESKCDFYPEVRVKAIPTADVVEVRHGEWREVNNRYPRYVCTICNHLFNNKNYNYCPNCGAKMDGERKD